MIGAFLLAVVVVFGIGLIFGVQWVLLPIGIAIGVLAGVSIFGRRVQRSVYAKAEGQPGAAGWALDNMRGPWRVTPGRRGHHPPRRRAPGDRPARASSWSPRARRTGSRRLLAQEKKRIARVVGSTPIYDFVVGNEEGQVPLRKLQQPPHEAPAQHLDQPDGRIEKRLAALGSRAAAMPKGPLPAGAKMRTSSAPSAAADLRARRCAASSARCGGASASAPPRCPPRGRASRGRRRRAPAPGSTSASNAVRSSARGTTDRVDRSATPPGCPAPPCPA